MSRKVLSRVFFMRERRTGRRKRKGEEMNCFPEKIIHRINVRETDGPVYSLVQHCFSGRKRKMLERIGTFSSEHGRECSMVRK